MDLNHCDIGFSPAWVIFLFGFEILSSNPPITPHPLINTPVVWGYRKIKTPWAFVTENTVVVFVHEEE